MNDFLINYGMIIICGLGLLAVCFLLAWIIDARDLKRAKKDRDAAWDENAQLAYDIQRSKDKLQDRIKACEIVSKDVVTLRHKCLDLDGDLRAALRREADAGIKYNEQDRKYAHEQQAADQEIRTLKKIILKVDKRASFVIRDPLKAEGYLLKLEKEQRERKNAAARDRYQFGSPKTITARNRGK